MAKMFVSCWWGTVPVVCWFTLFQCGDAFAQADGPPSRSWGDFPSSEASTPVELAMRSGPQATHPLHGGDVRDGNPSIDSHSAEKPCVLLTNGNVLYGIAMRSGDKVAVHQSGGGMLFLPPDKIACLGKSLQDLYRFRSQNRRGDRVAARLADVRWGLRYGLFDEVEPELMEVLRIDPTLPAARSLFRQLEGLRKQELSDMFAASSTVRSVDAVRPVSHQALLPRSSPNAELAVAEAADLSTKNQGNTKHLAVVDDALVMGQFTKDVQPFLLNRCSSCHSRGSGVAFELIRPVGRQRASGASTRGNLLSALGQLDDSDPAVSPLWLYAIQPHGQRASDSPQVQPVTDVQHAALQRSTSIVNLQNWIRLVFQRSVQQTDPPDAGLEGVPGDDLEALGGRQAVAVENGTAQQVDSSSKGLASSDDGGFDEPAAAANATSEAQSPSRLPVVKDPFDPAAFNRRFHRD